MKHLKLLGILAVLALIVVAALPAGADSGKPSVSVSDVKVAPAALMPGDTGTITVTLNNPAKSLSGASTTTSDTYSYGTGLSNGMVTPSHQSTTSVSSSSAPDGAVMLKEVSLSADAPIHVISRQQYLDLGRLGMGDPFQPLKFTIKVDDNAVDGIYQLTLMVRTDDGSIYQNCPIYVTVNNQPLKVSLNDAPKAFSTTKKSVILDIVNLRPNGVDGVSVVPLGDDFIFKPMQEYAVGSIGSGEMYTVQFDVTSKNLSYSGDPSFKVVYKNGDNWHEAGPLTIASDHSAAVSAPASADNSSLLYLLGIIVLAAIVLGGIYLYLRGKRAKR
jgi:hypothetical protein